MRLGKSLQRTFGLTLVVLLLAGCGGSDRSADRIATPTPAASPTPACALQCTTVKAHLRQSLQVNLYTTVGTSEAQVEGLQVDITCELGQASQRGSRESVREGTKVVVNIDEGRTYADTQRTYKIVGKISYGIGTMDTLAGYDLTLSGGVFGDTPQTCRKP